MHVVLLNQAFHPDVVATAQMAKDLADYLVAHGHRVTAVSSRSIYGQTGAALPRRDTVDGIDVRRVGTGVFGKGSIAARIADFGLFYGLAAAQVLTMRPKPDVVVSFTTPPFISLVGLGARALRGSAAVCWLMDMYPDLPVACGVMKPRSLPTRFFEGVSRLSLRRSDRVVVLGRCMLERVRAKGIPSDHVVHIGVWPVEKAEAGRPRFENPYRAEWGLADRFVVMYSGNFGIGHDVATMLAAAETLKDDDRIRFVFAGGGKKKPQVEAFVRSRNLTNCVLAPYQPRERLADSLSCADAHLASLLEGTEGIMVPSKLFGSMGAARPTIFIGHPSSELSRILTEQDAGFTVRQGDVDGLVAAIRLLVEDPALAERTGLNARRALDGALGREQACERWRLLLEEVVNERGGGATRGGTVGGRESASPKPATTGTGV